MTTWWPAGFLSFLLLAGAAACQRAPYRYQPPTSTGAGAVTPGAVPQLLFLSFAMTTEPNGGHHVAPLMMKTVPGQANPVADEEEATASYLLLTQLDAHNQPCGPARRVPHPLVQDAEAPAAPGTGALQRQTITLPQAEFFVRLARQPQARAVRVAEVGPAAPNPLSVTFPLPN